MPEREAHTGGETNLRILLQSMQPVLQDGTYVFCSTSASLEELAGLKPLCVFNETEGYTIILSREQADAAGYAYNAVFSMITLSIHSSLTAVGFLAAVSERLAASGISVNAVSAFYHDHLFIPKARADEAMGVLHELAHDANAS